MSFLRPLTETMTETDPLKRPTAEEALARFREIIREHDGIALRWHLRRPNERPRLLRDLSSAFWEVKYQVKHAICSSLSKLVCGYWRF